MENGKLDLHMPLPTKRRSHATLEAQVAIIDMLRRHVVKNTDGMHTYQGSWTDAGIAHEVSKLGAPVNANHVNRVRVSLFGKSRTHNTRQAKVEKASRSGDVALLASIDRRLTDIEARLEFAGVTLPQDAKK